MQKDSKLANLEATLPKPKAKKELEKISRRKTNIARIKEADTPEEKELVRQKIKLSQAKSNLTRATKNIKKLAKEENVSIQSLPEEILTELKLDQETNIIFKPNKGPQEEFLASSEDEVFYGGARGGGKGEPVSSLVVTPYGFKPMGELKEGSIICGRDGSPQKVLKIYELGIRKIYDVTFIDGRVSKCTSDHLWLIRKTASTSKKNQNEKFWTTEMIREWLNRPKKTVAIQRLTIPLCSPIKFNISYRYNPMTVDPYVLGSLIGDGCLRGGAIKFTTADKESVEELKKTGLDFIKGSKYDYNLRNKKDLKEKLTTLGLYNKTAIDKFIPKPYLTAYAQDRWALVQGLMDTDGTADTRGHISFCTISKQLAEDMQMLCWSLGSKATITTKFPTYTYKGEKKKGKKAYNVNIQHPTPVEFFRLKRKKDRCKDYKYNGGIGRSELQLAIKSVEYSHDEEARCISVENSDSLYIVDEYIVTHNTYVLIVDPLRECHNPNHRALFIRRTMPELRDIIHQTKLLYDKAYPGAKWKEQDKVWNFPSGARIEFGYAENINDALRYQGQQYTWIGFDELPQYPDAEVYNFIKSSLRSIDPTLKEVIRATGNPGNIGSEWVKKEFIDPAPANTTFYKKIKYLDPRVNKEVTRTVSRKFIPAKVWDNPYLIHNDNYIATLASLPEAQRKQFLEGDWTVIKGAAFPEFNKPEGTHVIEPFKIPNSWYRFRAADWGYSSPFCCLWFAVDFDGNLYVYREYYGSGIIADEWAVNVAKMEKQERVWYGVIDGSTDIRRGETGPSIYETINTEIKANGSVPFRFADRSPGSRAAGKQEVHKRLAVRPTGLLDENGNDILKPSLFIFNTCVNLIRTLPMLPLDKLDQEKVEKKSEDHAYDALHYGLRSRPINPAQMLDVNRFREQNMPKPADNTFGY